MRARAGERCVRWRRLRTWCVSEVLLVCTSRFTCCQLAGGSGQLVPEGVHSRAYSLQRVPQLFGERARYAAAIAGRAQVHYAPAACIRGDIRPSPCSSTASGLSDCARPRPPPHSPGRCAGRCDDIPRRSHAGIAAAASRAVGTGWEYWGNTLVPRSRRQLCLLVQLL
eukprot:507414-Prymnesium_polylepis.2